MVQMRKLDAPFDAYEEYLVPSTRSPWESVQWDSHIERDFVKDIEDISEVKLYIKLPTGLLLTLQSGSTIQIGPSYGKTGTCTANRPVGLRSIWFVRRKGLQN